MISGGLGLDWKNQVPHLEKKKKKKKTQQRGKSLVLYHLFTIILGQLSVSQKRERRGKAKTDSVNIYMMKWVTVSEMSFVEITFV